MEKYKIIGIGSDRCIIVSLANGNTIYLNKSIINSEEINSIISEKSFLKEPSISDYDELIVKNVYICLMISNKCNLNCEYCFNKNKDLSMLSIDRIKSFIDLIVSKFNNADRYIIDVSGASEPLLNMKQILQINEYAKKLSVKLKREVLVTLVSNGILLNSENVALLQNEGILFGVSLDGYRYKDNKKRFLSRKLFQKVMNNLKNIENNDFVGVAMTIHNDNTNLKRNLKKLIKIAPTISMKPVRDNNLTKSFLNKLFSEYEKLIIFLYKRTINEDYKYLFSLLNGDDYLGKYIYRIIINQSYLTRCDAGTGRFFLSTDGNIYPCPALYNDNSFIIGSINDGLFDNKIVELWNLKNIKPSRCKKCYAKFICGGECIALSRMVNKNTYEPYDSMCELK